MSLTLGTAVIELAVNSSKFTSELTKAKREFSGFAGGVQLAARGLTQGLSGIGSAVAALASIRTAVVAAAGAGGIGLLVNRSLETTDSLDKMAIRVGIGVERLQELQFAARSSGVAFGDLETGLTKLNQKIGQAVSGNAEAAKFFKDIGVSIRDSTGVVLDAGDLFPVFADKIKNAGDATERTRIQTEAFGKGGNALTAMLIEGSASFDRFAQQARQLGVVLEASVIREGVKAKEALDTLATITSTNLARAVVEIAPLFVRFSEEIHKTTKAAAEFWETILRPHGEMATAGALAAELENLSRLKKELADIQTGAGAGNALNRFFGQDVNALEAIKKSEEAVEAYRKTLRDFAKERADQNAANKPAAKGIAPFVLTPAAQNALDAFKQRLDEMALAGDPVALAFINIRQEAAKLAELGVAAKVIDKIADAMDRLVLEKAHETGVEKLRQSLENDIEDWKGWEASMFSTPSELIIEHTRSEARKDVEGFAEFVRQLNEDIKPWDGFEAGMVASSSEIIAATHGVTNGIKAVFDALDAGNASIARQKEVFGSAFDALPAQIDLVKSSILALLSEGLDPMDARIQTLKASLDGLQRKSEVFKLMEQLGTSAASNISGAITELVTTGKGNFADFAKALVNDMVRIMIQALITKVVLGAIGFATGGGDGGSGWGALAAAVARAFGSGGGGDGFQTGSEGLQHGGIVTRPTHALIGEAGPEAVIPLEHFGGLGSRSDGPLVEVNIKTEPGLAVEHKQQTAPNGKEIHNFFVRKMNDVIASGELDRTANVAWGVSRRGISR
jgi:tetratricopeptide (TPR) repeat protein